ncbi:GNAT family N-acetyltransferase [Reinekea sp. G2M2-21]|uniref:GNAT family N-acetyltransferase n=1 Tax=Reinekea sp. G2M2-21 TaxID=2788942 RepID=UPI001E4A4B69|nr:GNAT family N-acetyltransferase [Reinekea sp. G2M2-21]
MIRHTMNGELVVEPAAFAHAACYRDYINACSADPAIDHYDEALEDSDEYLLSVVNAAQGIGLPAGYLPQATFFAIRGGQIQGAIRLRLGSNAFVDNIIGHIGYEVRPDARNQGVARTMLHWVVNQTAARPVVITCGVDNMASRRVIESVGAEFTGTRHDEAFGEVLRFIVR